MLKLKYNCHTSVERLTNGNLFISLDIHKYIVYIKKNSL